MNKMTVLQKVPLELDIFYKNYSIPKVSLGDRVRIVVYLELDSEIVNGKGKEKDRTQAFEGIVISKHLNSKQFDATITIRKMFAGGGTEKVFVLNSPWIKSIDVWSSARVRRSKLYFLRKRTGKSARLKRLL